MWIVNEAWRLNEAEVPAAFKNNAIRELRQRWDWMTFDIHHVSYALAPDYHDENVFAMAPVMRALREIVRFFANNAADATAAFAEFAAFKNMNDAVMYPRDDNGKINTGSSPKSWWQLHGYNWPKLQPIALRVFSIGTSSSTSERNFSTWSHIWSDRANRLNFDRTVKLVYVYQNLRALQKLREGTGRTDHVETSWLATEIEE